MCTCLLRFDGQMGAIVNAEKHLVDPAVVSGEVAGQLGWIAQRMGLDAGEGAAEPSSSAPGFGFVKGGFTREAGSIRRQVPSRGLRDPGE